MSDFEDDYDVYGSMESAEPIQQSVDVSSLVVSRRGLEGGSSGFGGSEGVAGVSGGSEGGEGVGGASSGSEGWEGAGGASSGSEGVAIAPGVSTAEDEWDEYEIDGTDEEESKPLESRIVFDDEDEDFSEEDTISAEERARIHADTVMTTLVQGGNANKDRRNFLYGNATPELFRDENFVLYSIMYGYRNDNFPIDREFIETYLDLHPNLIENNSKRLDINAYGSVDGSAARGYAAGVVKYYDELIKRQPIDDETFFRSFENYLLYYQQIQGARLYSDAMTILQDGLKTRNKAGMLAGFEDSRDYLQRGIADIEGQINRNNGSGYISLREAITAPKAKNQVIMVTDFVDIQELTDHFGGLYTGQLITVVGPPKAGKSKLTARWVHNALMNGKNVTVWPVEGGIEMWTAQLRAIHFDYTYNKGTTDPREQKVGISQQVILQDKYDEVGLSEFRALEHASAQDLIGNGEYGQLDFVDRAFTVDTFLDSIDVSVKNNNSSMVAVDYMQLIQPNPGQTKQQALSTAYPRILDYAKKNNVLFVSPAQYSQEAVKNANKSGMNSQDLRVSVGESSEIVRSSDIVIAMSGSTEDLRNHRVWFESIPSRFAEPFERFHVYADLATCNFVSEEE